jgi:hypothetical protein
VFLAEIDQLAAVGASSQRTWWQTYQEAVAGLGIQTQKARTQDFLAPPGPTILATVCGVAHEGFPLKSIQSSDEYCALLAKLPRSFWSNYEGQITLAIARFGAGTRIQASIRIPGLLYDYGKSNRRLDALFRSIQDFCDSLCGTPVSLPVTPPSDAARLCASCKTLAAASDRFCMKCGVRLPS